MMRLANYITHLHKDFLSVSDTIIYTFNKYTLTDDVSLHIINYLCDVEFISGVNISFVMRTDVRNNKINNQCTLEDTFCLCSDHINSYVDRNGIKIMLQIVTIPIQKSTGFRRVTSDLFEEAIEPLFKYHGFDKTHGKNGYTINDRGIVGSIFMLNKEVKLIYN